MERKRPISFRLRVYFIMKTGDEARPQPVTERNRGIGNCYGGLSTSTAVMDGAGWPDYTIRIVAFDDMRSFRLRRIWSLSFYLHKTLITVVLFFSVVLFDRWRFMNGLHLTCQEGFHNKFGRISVQCLYLPPQCSRLSHLSLREQQPIQGYFLFDGEKSCGM